MKKIIRLTESDLVRIVKRVINEQTSTPQKGDLLELKCIDPFNNGFTTIGPATFVRYVKNLLILQKPPKYVSDSPFGNSVSPTDINSSNREQTLKALPVVSQELKDFFQITDDNTRKLRYYEGNYEYYCSAKKELSTDWQKFFDDNKIKV